MTHKFIRGWVLPGLILLLPLNIHAQVNIQLDTLTVEIWPEFDRPETLVIYRAELNSTTTLPAQLTFQLPGYIDTMHAIAVEQNGGLVDVPAEAIELRHEGDNLFLSFPSPSRKIQFEYYDPEVLSRAEQERQLDFSFATPYNTGLTTFQIQAPYQASNFTLTPEANNSFVGQDGLKYYSLDMAGLTPADNFTLAAAYSRDTDVLSIEQIVRDNPAQPAALSPAAEPPSGDSQFNWGYILIGAGILLLVGVAGYWWWSQQQADEPSPRRPRPGRRNKKQSNGEPSGGYCYRCGTALRNDADFCHQCGAERRR